MARRLYIVRHAQAEGSSRAGTDHARELTKQGLADARQLGAQLTRAQVVIGQVLASDATRALQTVDAIVSSQRPAPAVHSSQRLYQAAVETWLDAIGQLDEAIAAALVVGHNPVLSSLATDLCGQGVSLSTCQLVALEVAGPWSSIGPRSCTRLDLQLG